MMGFFNSRWKYMLILIALCMLAAGLILRMVTNTVKLGSTSSELQYAGSLFKYKTAYVGDNSKVVNLISKLPFADLRKAVTLKTKAAPYGIDVQYDFSGAKIDLWQVGSTFHLNAAVLFALIDNVDMIAFYVEGTTGQKKFRYVRSELQREFDKDLREYAKDLVTFDAFLKDIAFRLYVFPGKYTPAMSSTPGIRIHAAYIGTAGKVRYTAQQGKMFTWDAATGKISDGAPEIEVPYGLQAYWSPLANHSGQVVKDKETAITVALLDEKDKVITEKQVRILYDGSLFFSVQPSSGITVGTEKQQQPQKPQSLEDAISKAVKSRAIGYAPGELATEGHILLEKVEKDGIIKAYTVSSYGAYGFENGIFTFVSGSGAIPTVMTFSRNEQGEYALLEYKEPTDGGGYIGSIKEMFPKHLWETVLDSGKYPSIRDQQEKQAALYLQSIGREAPIGPSHIERKLADINVEASNKLFSEYTKYNAELNTFPYWLGTKEQIEDGIRYIYETSQSKTEDGYDLIVFRKTTEDGSLIKEYRYKIIGSEPQLLE